VSSGRFWGLEGQLKLCDLVAQMQATLFQPAQRQLVNRNRMRGNVNQGSEIGMFDFEFNQMPLRRM
jgi:hypothetical protein